MTTEELFNKHKNYTALTEGYYDYLVDKEDFREALIEFAKYHVEQALKTASEKVIIEGHPFDYELHEDSILNSYSLYNIK